MARIRTIKPEFWQDEKLAAQTVLTRLVFVGLISQADDGGRLVDSPKLIDGLLFPQSDDSCADALVTLHELGVIQRGVTASGQKVIQITNWAKHQKIEKMNLRIALPEITSPNPPGNVGETSGNGSTTPPRPFAPPTRARDDPDPDPDPDPENDPDRRSRTREVADQSPTDDRAETTTTTDELRRVATAWADQHPDVVSSDVARRRLLGQVERLAEIDTTVWQDDDGTPAPESARPRLLEYALSMVASGESSNVRSGLRYAVRSQLGRPLMKSNGSGPAPPAKVITTVQDEAAKLEAQQEAEKRQRDAAAEWRARRVLEFDQLKPAQQKERRKAAESVLGPILKRAQPSKREESILHAVFVAMGVEAEDPYPNYGG